VKAVGIIICKNLNLIFLWLQLPEESQGGQTIEIFNKNKVSNMCSK
jgi:hypothetical protein